MVQFKLEPISEVTIYPFFFITNWKDLKVSVVQKMLEDFFGLS